MKQCNGCEACKLTRNIRGGGETFNAACTLENIETGILKGPRTILFSIFDGEIIYTPGWCPKNKTQTRKLLPAAPAYTYTPRLTNIPKHLSWDEIKEGGIYVLPKHRYQYRTKVIYIKKKTDTFFRYCEVSDDGKLNSYETSIFKSAEEDYSLIVGYHKF